MRLFTLGRHETHTAATWFAPLTDRDRGARCSRTTRWIQVGEAVHYLRHRAECRAYRTVTRGGHLYRLPCTKETWWGGKHFGRHQSITGQRWSIPDGRWRP